LVFPIEFFEQHSVAYTEGSVIRPPKIVSLFACYDRREELRPAFEPVLNMTTSRRAGNAFALPVIAMAARYILDHAASELFRMRCLEARQADRETLHRTGTISE
jgi:hypothetical protein